MLVLSASLRAGQGSATLALLRSYPGELALGHDFSNHAPKRKSKMNIYTQDRLLQRSRSYCFHEGGFMSYTPNQELERLRKEKEKNEKKVEQLDHRIQRLENRIKYYKDVDRKKRTHRLCTVAGTLESIAPEIKKLDITEVMELLEHIFHMDDVKNAVNRMTTIHHRKAKED